ncbi:MAG: 2-amino-4-hydroxy-6-hydroxymethyldihydropteridine diphosphokinase [Ferruginibacter sp.]
MNTAYLLIGGNMGHRINNIKTAIKKIEQLIGHISRQSSIYETAAWGNRQQPDFLNQVIVVETKLDPAKLMNTILIIEEKMGRIRNKKNDPRVIDIDILFFERMIIDEKDLSVPHPQIQNRKFVLVPLNELSPNLKHPVLKKTIHQLLTICPDKLEVKKF